MLFNNYNVHSIDNSELDVLLSASSKEYKWKQVSKQIEYYRNNTDKFRLDYLHINQSSKLLDNIIQCVLYSKTCMLVILDDQKELQDIINELKELSKNKVIQKEIPNIINVLDNEEPIFLSFSSKSIMEIKINRNKKNAFVNRINETEKIINEILQPIQIIEKGRIQ